MWQDGWKPLSTIKKVGVGLSVGILVLIGQLLFGYNMEEITKLNKLNELNKGKGTDLNKNVVTTGVDVQK